MSHKQLPLKRPINNSNNNNGHSERMRKKKIDKVQCDGRLKIVINREKELRVKWQERWGFYSKSNVEKMWSEEAVKLGLPDDFIDRHRQKTRKQDRIQPSITVPPSPAPIPNTSSAFIGWRSSHTNCNLEMFGTYRSNKPDPQMLIPDDEPDPKHYKFIILG
ncbi:uncharacterized protein LOC126838660 [Adelges cooleyi]|uniref:uncharacterized protein LOC126838660 n=1 Tax=Adelges cooleyi TaxID=133065 RepID=UPI0021804DE9|nr:uncharacterized protein LOC126838660 [Adelges cooleyi]